jgi:peptidoglycan LD-endopeptidase CwlK
MASRLLSDLAEPVRLAAVAMLAKSLGKLNGKPVTLLIYCTLRDFDEQQELYDIGRIVQKDKAILTNCKPGQSLHNPDKNGKAWAFDAVPVVNGVAQWTNQTLLTRMGVAGEQSGLEWAGRWTGSLKETAHFQIQEKIYDR